MVFKLNVIVLTMNIPMLFKTSKYINFLKCSITTICKEFGNNCFEKFFVVKFLMNSCTYNWNYYQFLINQPFFVVNFSRRSQLYCLNFDPKKLFSFWRKKRRNFTYYFNFVTVFNISLVKFPKMLISWIKNGWIFVGVLVGYEPNPGGQCAMWEKI